MKETLVRAMDSERLDSDAVRALLEWQINTIPVYGRMCERQSISASSIQSWLDIPAVTASAFKRFSLFGGDDVAAEFHTSGTRKSGVGRCRFSTHGLEMMRESVIRNAKAMLFPNGLQTTIVVLAPSPSSAPQLIMSWGMRELIGHFGAEGSGFFLGQSGLEVDRLIRVLEDATEPVTLIGASFGFVHFMDLLTDRGWSCQLPGGSRVMDAGGFKGRSRVVQFDAFQADLERLFGVQPHRHVNVLGMTELASQFYDSSLRDPSTVRRKVNPPWTATAAMDPYTLKALPQGEVGLLRHLDLANLDRPFVIQTDDLGRCVEGGFEVLGRASTDTDRGCSITVDILLEAAQ